MCEQPKLCGYLCAVLAALENAGIAIKEEGSRHRLLLIPLGDYGGSLWVTENNNGLQLEANVIGGSSLVLGTQRLEGLPKNNSSMGQRLLDEGFSVKEVERHPWRERNTRGCIESITYLREVEGLSAVEDVVGIIQRLLKGGVAK